MVVIDTSVTFKWFETEQEELIERAFAILRDHLAGNNVIVVPELILYELANSWSTKSRLTANSIKIYLKDLEKYQLQLEQISFPLLKKAVDFSKKYNVTVYDASYAILAKEKRCNLVTADERFVKIVNLPYVKFLSSET